jgi:hypothetical protein
MMNLKATINFKTLREKGPSAVNIKGDEVVQIIGKGSEIKVIVTQEYFLNLLSAYNNILVRNGIKKEEKVKLEDMIGEFQAELKEMRKLLDDDTRDEDQCETPIGQKAVGSF